MPPNTDQAKSLVPWPCHPQGLAPYTPGYLINHGIILLQVQMVHKADQAVDDPLPEP